MLGNLATKQLFASANSIAVVPQINAEWNYNAIIQPSFVSSTIKPNLNYDLNNSSSWTIVPMEYGSTTKINGSIEQSFNGIKNDFDSSGSALTFTVFGKMPNLSGSAQGQIVSEFISSSVNLSTASYGKFYKVSFYVKTGGIAYTDGYPSKIYASATVTNTYTPTASYYYRVVGVGSENQMNDLDVVATDNYAYVLSDQTGSATITWAADPNSVAYRIYRSYKNPNTSGYLATTSSTTYVDSYVNCESSAYPPAKFSGHISIVPQIIASGSVNGTTSSDIPIVYYIKSTDTQVGKLIKNVNNIECNIDGWKKVEVWFGVPSENSFISMQGFSLKINAFADYEGAKAVVDGITISEVTQHDFYQNEYYPAESAFFPLRPGEALLNELLPDSEKITYLGSTGSAYKPTTFGIKSPQIYFGRDILGTKMQMLPTPYDKFKYYVSDTNEKSIQAQYDSYFSINKIVFKYDTTLTKPTSGSVVLYTGVSGSTVISLSSSDFNDNGLTVIYYDGSNWSTSSWTSPPQLTASGTFQNVLNQVRGIGFKAGSISSNATKFNLYNEDFNKIHIVELSPRLELDLSPILMDYSIRKDLTSQNSNGFPFSYINSNTGNIVFSNIPFYQSDGSSGTIFENRSSSATFYNLLRQNVKFTGFLKNPSFDTQLTEKVPQFVMYAQSWDVNDINTVNVEVADITKAFAQYTESAHYAAYSNKLFTIITSLLNSCGFSDYDYDGLYNVCKISTNTSNFWADETQTIFEILQELFVIHQIGAYIDEYGIMRFKSLKQMFNQFNSGKNLYSAVITDIATTASGVSYIPNIIPDSYSETVSPKIGKILVRYQVPRNFQSIDISNDDGSLGIYNKMTESSKMIWSEQNSAALSSLELAGSLLKNDSFLQLKANDIFGKNPRKWLQGFEGDVFVGNEIIGYSGLEYVFYSPENPNVYISRVVRSREDIDDAIETLRSINASNPNTASYTSVLYNPTGNIYNLQRGKYGTPINDHYYYNWNSDVSKNFETYIKSPDSSSATLSSSNLKLSMNNGLTIESSIVRQYNFITPKNQQTNNYNLFSVEFEVPTDIESFYIKKNVSVKTGADNKDVWVAKKGYYPFGLGMFLNMTPSAVYGNSNTSPALFIELRLQPDSDDFTKAYYNLYVYNLLDDNLPNNNFSKRHYAGQKIIGTKTVVPGISIENVFNGKIIDNFITGAHRLSAYIKNNYVKIYLNKKLIGQFAVPMSLNPNSFFGYFQVKWDSQIGNVQTKLLELYADTVADENKKSISAFNYSMNSDYLFFSKYYLNNIVRGIPNNNNCYLWQWSPKVRGVKVYDVKHSLSPIYPETSYLYPHLYGSTYDNYRTNEQAFILGPVIEEDTQSSELFSTPFSTRFAIVNNSNEFIWLKSDSDTSVNPIQIHSKNQELSQERIIERVIDPNYTQSTVELQSKWFASESEAEKILDLLSKSNESFYTTISLSIFGNPLIQVGDFVQLKYSLKRLGLNSDNPLICLVTSVNQGFSGGVNNTQLTLKPLIIK